MSSEETDSRMFGISRWLTLLVPAPAVFLGVFVMARSGVPTIVWAQNLAVWLVATVLCITVIGKVPVGHLRLKLGPALMLGAIAMLGITLLSAGTDGVHRWLNFGAFRLHASSIILPILLIGAGNLTDYPARLASPGPILITALLLVAQPDAGQSTAFAVAAGMQFILRKPPQAMGLIVTIALLCLTLIAWMRPDPLPVVPHVEGILGQAKVMGLAYAVLAVGFLCLLPSPFLAAAIRWRRGDDGYTALALGIYFVATLIVPAVGNFPVPILGFGASPIIGFFIGLGWVLTRTEGAAFQTRPVW